MLSALTYFPTKPVPAFPLPNGPAVMPAPGPAAEVLDAMLDGRTELLPWPEAQEQLSKAYLAISKLVFLNWPICWRYRHLSGRFYREYQLDFAAPVNIAPNKIRKNQS